MVVVATHPIQYHAPRYRQLAQSDAVDLRVAFLSGLCTTCDPGFGKQVANDIRVTAAYVGSHGETRRR
jgi:hypothetical protein